MRCDHCDAPAVIHLTRADGRGGWVEGHYCRGCAAKLRPSLVGCGRREFRRRRKAFVIVFLIQSLAFGWIVRDEQKDASLLRLAWLAPLCAVAALGGVYLFFKALRTATVRRAAASNRVLLASTLIAAAGLAVGAWLDVPHPPPPAAGAQSAILGVVFAALLAPFMVLSVRLLAWSDARLRREGFGLPARG